MAEQEQDKSKHINRESELAVENVPKEPSQHELFKTCHRFANLDQQHTSLKVYKTNSVKVAGEEKNFMGKAIMNLIRKVRTFLETHKI